MTNFNRVIIRDMSPNDPTVASLAVHPFPFDGQAMMLERGVVAQHEALVRMGLSKGVELSEWQKELADSLWDNLPTLQSLQMVNGMIALQHSGAFEPAEISEAAIAIIKPYLEMQLYVSTELSSLDDV